MLLLCFFVVVVIGDKAEFNANSIGKKIEFLESFTGKDSLCVSNTYAYLV